MKNRGYTFDSESRCVIHKMYKKGYTVGETGGCYKSYCNMEKDTIFVQIEGVTKSCNKPNEKMNFETETYSGTVNCPDVNTFCKV